MKNIKNYETKKRRKIKMADLQQHNKQSPKQNETTPNASVPESIVSPGTSGSTSKCISNRKKNHFVSS